ncbi:unnamed protein product [Schistosoma mattheei]|uniref:Uncharacterized protein n=1 Tax=Schistosoma mattheei TaxID=31246 RepID=A0A183Q804_9TREM|nr:unnamed protein product [Schistosoma mattheei]
MDGKCICLLFIHHIYTYNFMLNGFDLYAFLFMKMSI